MAPKRKSDSNISWEFEDNDGNWIAYAAEDSTYLEKEFQSGKKTLQTTKLSFNKDYGTTYKFDFKAMTQLNTESKTKRTIRRNEPLAKKETKKVKKIDQSHLKGKTLVFTGTLSMKRDKAADLAQKAGANVTSAISGKTDIVVAGPGAGDKLAKAKAQNCEIWTEYEFQKAVGEKTDSSSSRDDRRDDIGEEACPEAGARVHFCGCLMNDKKQEGWTSIPYVEDQYGEYVGLGRYPQNSKAFPNAIKATFDSVAVDAGTRVIIYEKPNFKGKVLWDKVGPAIICNEIWKNNTFAGKKYGDVLKGTWEEPLNTIFPPEVRELSKTNMHGWNNGSLVIEGGQAIPDRVDSLPEYARLSNPRQ